MMRILAIVRRGLAAHLRAAVSPHTGLPDAWLEKNVTT